MIFTWTRDGERITSTCPRCHATETSRFTADVRRWQRSHTALACWRGRQRPQIADAADHRAPETPPRHPTDPPAFQPPSNRVSGDSHV